MKKLIALLPLLLIFCGNAQTGAEEKEDKALRVRCKVKSVTVYQADYQTIHGSSVLGQQYKTGTYKYDRRGELTDEISYNKRGTIEGWMSYKPEKDTGMTYITRNTDGSVHHKNYEEYVRDSLGRLALSIFYAEDGTETSQVRSFYDSLGRVEQNDNYTVYGEKKYLDTYQKNYFDMKGRITLIESFDRTGNYQQSVKFKYDAKGKLIEKTNYYASVYKYGGNGLAVEVTVYGGANGDTPVSVRKNVYEYYQ